jgi:CheY-like chemotaxis protein
MDGYAVAQRMREQPGGKDLRLIAVTGYGQAQDRERALAAGFDRHVTKPVDPVALERLVSEL